METTSFNLSGNVWFFIVISGLLIAFSIYSYIHTNPHISYLKKGILITLRSLGLILLLFILFQPSLVKSSSRIYEPKLAVLIDNSVSNGLVDSKFNRKEVVNQFINNFKFQEFNDNVTFYSFAGSTRKFNNFANDSLDFSGQTTDLQQVLQRVKFDSKDNNYQAIMLISDGAINSGNNPLYSIDNLYTPIFTVGIGDSVPPKDISVISLISNEVAFIETPTDVFVNITSNGFEQKEVSIGLYENDILLEETNLKISNEQKDYSYKFIYTPLKDGIQKLTVRVKPLDNEYTTKNNSADAFIKIIKNKRIISIFASSPSPDLSLINQYLSVDKEVKINQFIQKNGPEFYIQPTQSLINETQLFILIGFPNKQTPEAILSLLSQELSKGKPLLFIAGNQLDFNKLSKLSQFLPFDVISSSNREFTVWVDPVEDAVDNPLLRIEGIADSKLLWENLTPVFKTETFVNPKIESKVLATSKIENVKFNEPMILIREVQGNRSVAIMAYNLYRWKLSGFAKELVKGNSDQIDLFNVFMNNSIRWLSVSNIEKQLIVKTNKKHYSTSEQIEFKGNVWDNSMNPIENARITIKLSKKNFEKNFELPALGNGVYFTKISPLPKGDYRFKAEVTVNNKFLSTDEGYFVVGAENFEYIDIAMNKKLLFSLSENSGGVFFTPDEYSKIPDKIKKLKTFVPSTKTIKINVEFWNHWTLLLLSILLFSSEWFIRKRLSML
jgi:hypothetical protein